MFCWNIIACNVGLWPSVFTAYEKGNGHMAIIIIILAVILFIVYTTHVDFGHPPSVALWCVVMMLAWVAIGYGGLVIYALQ
jgi:hypothetical protein